MKAFLFGMGTGDTWDGYFYNNASAAGDELYPLGLNKYYDMYSIIGLTNYFGDWMWINVCNMLSPLTLFIPYDLWQAWIYGYSWNEWWLPFLPGFFREILGLRGEADWPLD